MDEHTALRADAFTRDRSQTISVMSPARKSRYELDLNKPKPHSPRNKDTPRSGVSPRYEKKLFFKGEVFFWESGSEGLREQKGVIIWVPIES